MVREVSKMGMATALAMVLASPALAHQDSVATPQTEQPRAQSAQPAEETGLTDIVVSARRTNESLQVVPVAVTALTGDFLSQQNVVDVTAIPQFTPNLTISQQSGSLTAASVYIRGIGNQEPSSVAEQGVGIYLDGVYIARSAGALFDLVDLERLEVLRGPQGTLFGRNSVGGAMQLVSRKPSDKMGAEVKGGYGSYNDWFVRARVDSGYIAGSPFRASLSVMHRERDGYVDNLLQPSNRDPGALNSDALIFALQGDLGDVTVNYSFDYNDRRGSTPYAQVLAANPDQLTYFGRSASLGGDPFLVGQARRDEGLQIGFTDTRGRNRVDSQTITQGHSLTVEYQPLPALTFKSITGYRKFEQDTILTLGGNGDLRGVVVDFNSPTLTSVQPVGLYNGNNAPQKQWQFSQEFQLLGSSGDFSYVAGAYYFYENSGETNRQALTLVTPVAGLPFLGFPQSVADGIAALNPGLDLIGLNLTPVQAFDGTAESMAVFGQVSWRPAALDGRLELTGGLRYTGDRKTILLRGDVQPNQAGHVDFTNVSWLASVNYRITNDVMVYGRASTGYRSGGISPRTNTISTFRPETVLSYEAGLKSEFLGRRVRLNLAVFQTDYDDQQINQFAAGSGGATSVFVNAGKVRLRGVEAELTAVPVDGLTLDGSVGYTDPDYQQYLFRDPATNQLIDVADEARLPQTSQFNAHAGGQYEYDIGIGTLTARVDYAFRGTVYYNNLDRVNPYNVLSRSRPDHNLRARLSLSDIQLASGALDIGVWGNNLTNQENIDFAIDYGALGFVAASFKQPRTFGVDARMKF